MIVQIYDARVRVDHDSHLLVVCVRHIFDEQRFKYCSIMQMHTGIFSIYHKGYTKSLSI